MREGQDEDWTARFAGLVRFAPEMRAPPRTGSRVATVPRDTVILGPGKAPEYLLLRLGGCIRVQQASERLRQVISRRLQEFRRRGWVDPGRGVVTVTVPAALRPCDGWPRTGDLVLDRIPREVRQGLRSGRDIRRKDHRGSPGDPAPSEFPERLGTINERCSMPCSVGPVDRVLRLALGVVLLLLPLLTGFAAGTTWLWRGAIVIGLVMLATAGTRVCPLDRFLGPRTCAP